jgi:hypothetical protein
MLNHILAVFRRRFAPQELRASLREVGRRVAQEHLENVKGKSRDQRIEFALNLLRTLGGDAMGEESEGKYLSVGTVARCPRRQLTALRNSLKGNFSMLDQRFVSTIAWHDATRSFRVLVFQQFAAAAIF